jgi:hypothetical protein
MRRTKRRFNRDEIDKKTPDKGKNNCHTAQ